MEETHSIVRLVVRSDYKVGVKSSPLSLRVSSTRHTDVGTPPSPSRYPRVSNDLKDNER